MAKINLGDKRDILDMTNIEARNFFLKQESYFNCELPSYFNFEKLLKFCYENIQKSYSEGNHVNSHFSKKEARKSDKVNCIIYANKDGKYEWRPLEIINPYLYCELVYLITEEQNWKKIVARFKENLTTNIIVAGLPVESKNKNKDKKSQILNWWSLVEQKSLELALEYKKVIHLDISNCYGSIYTHSIAWALHDKELAKDKMNNNDLLGNKIDNIIRTMHSGQTNGIPQGSVLMDFLAELVLSYCDKLLIKSLNNKELENCKYKIIRYRDDYRIFSNSKSVIEKVTKDLNDVLMTMNFKLNSKKTKYYEDTVLSSIKRDKIECQRLESIIYYKENNKYSFKLNCQKHLLQILLFSKEFSNSGSVSKMLDEFNKYRHEEILSIKDKEKIQCISIITEIMQNNFRAIPICVSILSKILNSLKSEDKKKLINFVIDKFNGTPNVDLLNIWLQRLTLTFDVSIEYETALCQLISDHTVNIFDTDWVKPNKYKVNDQDIINYGQIKNLKKVIDSGEVSIFYEDYLM